MTPIKIDVRTVYGVEKIYPACDTAKLIAAIAGTKTLTRETLRLAWSLGFAAEVITTPFVL